MNLCSLFVLLLLLLDYRNCDEAQPNVTHHQNQFLLSSNLSQRSYQTLAQKLWNLFSSQQTLFNVNHVQNKFETKSIDITDREQITNQTKHVNANQTWIYKLQNLLEILAHSIAKENLTNEVDATNESVVTQQFGDYMPKKDDTKQSNDTSTSDDIGESYKENDNKPSDYHAEGNNVLLNETIKNDYESQLESCQTFDGTVGYCQPTQQCIMSQPDEQRFHVCRWGDSEELDAIGPLIRSPPRELCCAKVTLHIDQLKLQFEQWLTQAKLEVFATGLPKKPNGKCGVALVERERRFDDDFNETMRRNNALLYLNGNSPTKIKKNKVRIVLGRNALIGQIPWMVSIFYRDQFICGGTIITEYHIITAAHCLSTTRNPTDYSIRYETVLMYNGTRIRVKSFILHKNYLPPAIYHDIALIKLEMPIRFTPFTQPACLPGKHMYNELMIGQTGFVAGFGDLSFGGTQATVLQVVDVKIINNTYCDTNYRRLTESGKKFQHGIGKTLICAGHKDGGKDACQGDSGGPLTLNYRGVNYLIGIVSFGYRCALPRFPGVYTCVAHYLDWIFSNLNL